MRSKWMSLTLMVVMAIASGSLLAACGGGGNDCGPGTVEEGGRCVPLCAENQYWDGTECKSVTTCANGTTLNPATGECEPACGEGQYWDGTACVDAPECGDGTVFNPDTGQCEPECGTDEYWDGTACVAVPECPGGYTFNPTTGECENDCPPGTFWDDVAGDCVDACGDGTVLHDGECVPWIDVVEADYPEAAENNDPSYGGTPGAFDVPAIDAEDATILGGVIGVPADLDGDEVEDVDIDCWLFAGTAEMRLEIDGWADGLFNVATFVQGVGEENSFYWRYGLNPDGAASERQVVLPLDGDYMICASDYSNFTGDFPVGGDDLGYFIAIRQLVNPAPTQSSLGSAVTGAVWDLDQYVVTGTAGELVDVVINDWNADNLGLITIKNASGDLIGQLINSFSFWGMVYEIPFDPGMKFTLAMPADGGMMMTMDYRYRTAGGNDYDVTVQYNPDVEPVTQIPADLNGEDLGSSAAEKIYQIDAEAGKLYYMLFENLGADVTASLIGVLRDANYNVISYVDTEYDPAPYELFFYAKEDTRFYIEVFDYYQEEGSDYTYDLSIDVYDVTDMGTLDENNTQATLAGEGPIAAAGDQFWYAITFAADGNVTGTFTPYNFDVAVEIFDEMVTPLAIEDYMLVGEAETFTYIMGAATFLFRVTESGMDEGDNGYTFDIDIQYEAFPAEAEPNDDMAHATPFVYDPADPWTIYSGHIDTASDLDWYAFTVTESGVLWAQTLAGTPYADTEIWIYDTDGTTVLANNDDYSYDHYFSYAEAELMAAGTYYIVVGCTSVADYCVPDVDYLLAAGFLAGECMIGNAYCADASTLMECQDGTGYVATTCDYGCDDSTGVAQCTPPPLDEVEPND
ncbi:MAG: pre-peptidase C-terminal domain-containing protein, partial [Deltaproteobacteria bacterium]|nr:pre-peptidase C-terminal domain-containing protein [Deltaproteobacteria bacterium]